MFRPPRQFGLVNEVVPDDELLDRACALAAHIAGFVAVAVAVAPDWERRPTSGSTPLGWDDAQGYSVHTSAVIAAEQGASAGHGRTSSPPATEPRSRASDLLPWALVMAALRCRPSRKAVIDARLAADPVPRTEPVDVRWSTGYRHTNVMAITAREQEGSDDE
ncbi:hypothetical protein [Rhodococcus koreensis]